MSHRARRVSVLVLAVAIAAQLGAASHAFASDRYIVVLRDDASSSAAAKRHGAAPSHVYSHALRGYAATLSDASLAAAHRDPAVRFISADRPISVGKPGGGSGGTTSGQVTPTGILRIGQALERRDGSSANDGLGGDIDVAVIDTGIDGAHADLVVEGGYNCSSGTSWSDGNGHGTHVAGTIGAKDNAIGVVGVAPGVSLHAVRVLNNAGSGSWSTVACGIDWVAANPDIEVANLSLGGAGSAAGTCATTTDVLHLAICNLANSPHNDVNIVVAAGNDDADASTFTPAAYDEVITVSAWADFNGSETVGYPKSPCRSDVDETFADFSNWGAPVDIAAPGVCINSTWKGGGYKTISGTSMASPHVAGAAALHRARTSGATAASTRDALLASRTLLASPPPDDGDGTWEGLLSILGW